MMRAPACSGRGAQCWAYLQLSEKAAVASQISPSENT